MTHRQRALGVLVALLVLSATTTTVSADVLTSPAGGFSVGISAGGTIGNIFTPSYSTGFLRTGAGGFDVLGSPAQSFFLHREAWGITAGGVSGYVDPSKAVPPVSPNITLVSPLTFDPVKQTESVTLALAVPGGSLQIKQVIHFAAENVIDINVTLTNMTSGPLTNVEYRRLMSWEIPPWNGSPGSTAVNDQVVIPPFASPVVQASAFPNDYSAIPTASIPGEDSPPGGEVVGGNPNSVADLGAVITLALGTIPGPNPITGAFSSISFDIFEALNQTGQSGSGLVSELNGLGANFVILGTNAYPPAGTNFAAIGVEVTVVPEPATVTLLGLGLAGLAGWRWRRRPA